jgi:hypothetical protein
MFPNKEPENEASLNSVPPSGMIILRRNEQSLKHSYLISVISA